MIGVFYWPYQDMDILHNTTEEISAKTYLDLLAKDTSRYGSEVNYMMTTRYTQNMSDNEYEKWKRKYKQQSTGFIPCRCNLLTKDGTSLSESDVVVMASTPNQQSIIIIQLDKQEYELDDVFNREIETWMMRTKKIQGIPLQRFDRDPNKAKQKQLASFPTKNIRLQTDGGNFVVLKDVRFIQNKGAVSSFAVLVGSCIYLKQDQINSILKKK